MAAATSAPIDLLTQIDKHPEKECPISKNLEYLLKHGLIEQYSLDQDGVTKKRFKLTNSGKDVIS